MTSNEAHAAVQVGLRLSQSQSSASGSDGWAEYDLVGTAAIGPAVTTYYDESGRLSGLAVDALRGPQVTLDGLRLVGRTPSRLEDEFHDYVTSRGQEVRYSQLADPWAPQLGLVLRAQRAGDVVLSRPVVVAQTWAERCGDTTEGAIPMTEWQTFA
ncbi:hypothetical protein [Cryptosporangium minutisporangium]